VCNLDWFVVVVWFLLGEDAVWAKFGAWCGVSVCTWGLGGVGGGEIRRFRFFLEVFFVFCDFFESYCLLS